MGLRINWLYPVLRDKIPIKTHPEHDTKLNLMIRFQFFYGVVYPHTYISGNRIKHNLRTSMNERTHFFIKIYLWHFILERVNVSVVCERWVETGTDFYIDPTSSPDHRTLLSSRTHLALLQHLGWSCSTGGHWGLLPSAGVHTLGFLSPTNSTAAGICLYTFITPTCFRFFFRLFTQVHFWLTARSRVNI